MKLTGICNPLVDILVKVSEEEFVALEIEKATMRLVDKDEQEKLLERISLSGATVCSGGSVANSIVAYGQLGGDGAILGTVGEDPFGHTFITDINKYNVTLGTKPVHNMPTGTCLSIITPDSERTLRTFLGASQSLSPEFIHGDVIRSSDWIFVEGFPLLNGEGGRSAVRESVDIALESQTKIAVTCSEPIVVQLAREELLYVMERSDLLFANEEESKALSGKGSVEDAFSELALKFKGVVVTAGARGAFVSFDGFKGHVEGFKASPLDLTGAGDMFAAGFLFGVTHGFPAQESAKKASFLAKAIIEQIGARYHGNLKELWDQI
jgi:sugar/nucleoside kinase (ribokinase family)